MASGRSITCPHCGIVLKLPVDLQVTAVRCGGCRNPFQISASNHADEDPPDWLNTGPPKSTEPAAAKTVAPFLDDLGLPQQGAGAKTKARPTKTRIRLVQLERRGALFEFPAERLREDAFRCAIPRVCIHCQTRAHLSAHVIIFTGQLRDSVSLEAEHKAGQLTIPQSQIGDLSGPELLARLPNVPNVPSPGDLPMPYWVCDLCSGTGEISGQIRVNSTTGEGFCRLLVRNLSVALPFFEAIGGKGTKSHAEFQEFLQHFDEDRWDALPSVVLHRVEQWFRPKTDERFIAYISDGARRRSEIGMAGVAISDKRFVYHRPPMHHELARGTALAIQVRLTAGKEVVTFHGGDMRRRPITLDRRGLMRLRRSLSEGRFKAKWT